MTGWETASKRFWAMVDASGDCWEWTGSRQSRGYGKFAITAGASRLAHRFAYEDCVGLIPEGSQIDHLCRNLLCVNPDHLQPVTQQENMARGYGQSVLNAAKTHCPQGHCYDEENTYWRGNKRVCRTCDRERYKAPRPPRTCKVCETEFKSSGPALYCSDACRKTAARERLAARTVAHDPQEKALVAEWFIEPDLSRLPPIRATQS